MAGTPFSLHLEMDMDERRYDRDATDFVRQSYEPLAPVKVKTHEGRARYEENVIVCVVEGSCDGDGDTFESWLVDTFDALNDAIADAHRKAREAGRAGYEWSWVKVVADEGVFVMVKTDSSSQLPGNAAAMVCKARSEAREGVFGAQPKCVFIPSRDSYDAQLETVIARDKAADAERSAADNAINERAHVQAAQALDSGSVISRELYDLALADGEARKLDALEDGLVALAGEEVRERVAPVVPPAFDVDYGTWQVFFQDGGSKLFDSASGTLR